MAILVGHFHDNDGTSTTCTVIALRAFLAIMVRWEVQIQLGTSPRQQHIRYVCLRQSRPSLAQEEHYRCHYEVEGDTE
ncbi:hypothetical protein K503DRAFT_515713 [Rhizopogon vinicolor AM-OR11-026]|uniref:Uncharacterized protein n=1 Tax=Rhizopogon vinicolor AM-OR11-026 TaxID=1314800 RepID=A0A1B7MLS8_9AGAM|nr:hypothetical protein K503DRAFT_515713 [Rhizopogon vinicolor AM-OR11-026]